MRRAVTRGAWGLLLTVTWAGCSWDAFWGLDAPRPSLSPSDVFFVEPRCPQLIVDPDALADAPLRVTITGRRVKSALGAEGVPVTVRRGPCEDPRAVVGMHSPVDAGSEPDGAAVDDGVADAGPSTDGGPRADAGPDAGLAPEPVPACGAASAPLDVALQNAVELIGMQERGCRQLSPSLLECTLDPEGEAAFELRTHLDAEDLGQGGYVPLCITPLELEVEVERAQRRRTDDPRPRDHQIELHVVPRLGHAAFALAVLEAEASPAHPRPADAGAANDCAEAWACDSLRQRATFHVGLVGRDTPTDQLRSSDFLELKRELTLDVELRPLSALPPNVGEPVLSSEQACAGEGDAGVTKLAPITIPRNGVSASFYLCASGHEGSFLIAPRVIGIDGLSAAAPSEVDAPLARSRQVALEPQVQGYVAEPLERDTALSAVLCGGAHLAPEPGTVQVVGRPEPAAGAPITLGCTLAPASPAMPAADAGSSTDDTDGGADPEPASSPSAPVCEAVELVLLAGGGMCSLDVGADR